MLNHESKQIASYRIPCTTILILMNMGMCMCVHLPAHCLGILTIPIQESLLYLQVCLFLEEYSAKNKTLPQVKLRPIA